MKHLRRILSICLAVVMMCSVSVWAVHPFPSEVYPGKYVKYYEYHGGGTYTYIEVYGTTETGIYGTNDHRLSYPITARFFDRINTEIFYEPGHYDYWYDHSYKSYPEEKVLEYLSDLWFTNYRIVDPEIWPVEYLNRYEEILDGHQTVMSPSGNLKYRVDSYEWEDRSLTVNCAADYDIKGYNVETEYDEWLGTIYHITADGGFSLGACIAVTNKSDGEMVYLVKHSSFNIQPDYVCIPGSYSEYVNDCYECPYTSSQLNTSHSGTATQTLKAVLPEFFDPEEHDVTLYFYDTEVDGNISELNFLNPQNISPIVTDTPNILQKPGDVNGDSVVTVADATTLSRYISGASVEIFAGADFNGDGVTDSADLIFLRRKIAGADV